jgi:hypothetical protein
MKKYLLLFLLLTTPAFAQISFTGSMGINYFSAPAVKDYLNMYYPSGSGLISTFTPSVGFYGELSMPVSANYDIGVEYIYQIYSYNAPSISGGVYNFSLDQQKISLLGYYVIRGTGYQIKFGAGAGLRLASVNEEIYSSLNYTSSGFGLLGRGCFLTGLGKNLFANIGADIGYDFPGEPSNGGKKIVNGTLNNNINVNSFYLAIKIGVTYTF